MGKTFSIDLKSLYEHILDSHTYFGCWTGNCWTHGVIKRAA